MENYFIKNKAIFGGYPTQDVVTQLEENHNVVLFVDLTQDDEKNLKKYVPKQSETWRFQITDQKHPVCIYKYCAFIMQLSCFIDDLKDDQKIYLHCRGGHGRSGLVVASLLIFRNKITIEEGIQMTNVYHRQRHGLSEKWHKIRIPNHAQINFLYKVFNPIIIVNKPFVYKSTLPSLLHKTSIHFEDEDLTYNSGAIAFYSYKDLEDKEYISALNSAKTYMNFIKVVASKEWKTGVTFQHKVNRIVKILSFLAEKEFQMFQNVSSLCEIYCDLFAYEFPCSQNVIGMCYRLVILRMHNRLIV